MSGCRSPYEIHNRPPFSWRSVSLLPFSLWDSASTRTSRSSRHWSVAVLLMRFPWERRSVITAGRSSCRSPYEILRRRSKSKNPSLSCCRSPYEIPRAFMESAEDKDGVIVAVLLMRFNMSYIKCPECGNEIVAVLLMRFQACCWCSLCLKLFHLLPFSLWDSVMAHGMKTTVGTIRCRSPYEILRVEVMEDERRAGYRVAVLLMRFSW